MAYGMYLPNGGGPFGPYGDDEGPVDVYGGGWHYRLMKDYDEKLSEEMKAFYKDARSYRFNVWNKLIYECGTKSHGSDGLILMPIEEHEPPKFYQIEKGYSELSSIISLSSRRWAVDENVKAICEYFEPERHQFYPLEIRMPGGKVYPVQYYSLVIGTYLEGFSPEKSNSESFKPNGPKRYSFRGDKKSITGLALDKAVIEGAHLWRERGFDEWLICFSDRFETALAAANLKLPKYYRMKEV
jgi:hypothetical protein